MYLLVYTKYFSTGYDRIRYESYDNSCIKYDRRSTYRLYIAYS